MIKEKIIKSILSEQRKTNEILDLLKKEDIDMTDRQWRSFVRQYNDKFASRDRYIASNSQGYFLTTNKAKITKTAMNKLKNALSMLKNAKADLDELKNKDQLSLLKEDVDIYDLAMKLKV